MRILYVDIDSLRADHLGCYGYGRPTSPVIDGLARRGARLEQCHTSDAPCLPSRAALFSGRFGIENGVTCHEGPAALFRYPGRGHRHDPARPMWMRVLQQAGWRTVSFSGFAQRHLAWWFAAGFTEFYGNQLPGGPETADEVAGKGLEWLRANGGADDWFLHLTFWDVHTTYHTPEPYRARIRGGDAPAHPTAAEIAADVERWYGPRTARDWWHDHDWRNPGSPLTRLMPETGPVDRESYLGFLEGYDAGIAYVDECLGRLLEELERLGVREETAVVVSSDHGEAIGELGMYFEHGNATEGVTNVPLVVDWPGATAPGTVITGQHYQLDLPPTVLALLGMPVPEGWSGRSFADALGGAPDRGRPHLVLGAGIYSYQRAVRTPTRRLVRTLHPGLYPYDDLYLFDLTAGGALLDPGEEPDTVAELDHVLLAWVAQRTTGPAAVADPFQLQLEAEVSPDLYCPRERMESRLERLGRRDQLADLRRRRGPTPPPRPW